MTVRRSWLLRAGSALTYFAGASMWLVPFPYATLPWRIACVCAAVAAIAIAIRVYRLGVVTRPGSLTVHGVVRSRTIQRISITEIDDGYIEWKDSAGVSRSTPVTAFLSLGNPDSPTWDSRRRNEAMIVLRKWLGESEESTPQVP